MTGLNLFGNNSYHKLLLLLFLVVHELFVFNIMPCVSQSSSSSCNYNTSRCGTSWNDANSRCGDTCPCNLDSECSNGQYCFGSLSSVPCLLESSNITISALNISIPTVGSCGSESLFPLAFDDGPWTNHNASLILAQKLYDANISGTFFVSPGGVNADDETEMSKKCSLIGKLLDYGHFVESHSWTHADFSTLTYNEIIDELTKTKSFIRKCAKQGGYDNYEPTMFRPPFGRLNVTQAKLISDLGYIIVSWNFDSEDYSFHNNITHILNHFINNDDRFINDSSISALFHDFSIYEVIEDVIDYALNDIKYEIVNSKECYERCDTLDSYGICLDPHGNDWSTIYLWYDQISFLQYYYPDTIYDYFTFDIPTTTYMTTINIIDELDDDDENSDFFYNATEWVYENPILSAIIAISVFICGMCCIIHRLCKKHRICVVDDGFDEYFRSRHGHHVSPQDVSIQSQTA